MEFYKYLLIYSGIFILIILVGYVISCIISHIDYKRQISGKRKMREYKGSINYAQEEQLNTELEIERASKGMLTKNEMSHRI